MKIEQGDILRVRGQPYPVVVVSNNFFNGTGKAIVCPVRKDVPAGPLHLPLKDSRISGSILCEHVHYQDLTRRSFRKIGSIPYFDIMDFSDAIMGIFDYQTN